LLADLVLALPRPDRVRLFALRARKAAEPEYQRCRNDRLHDRLREMSGGKLSDADRLHPLPAILPMPRTTARMAWPSAGSRVRRWGGGRDVGLVRARPERRPEGPPPKGRRRVVSNSPRLLDARRGEGKGVRTFY